MAARGRAFSVALLSVSSIFQGPPVLQFLKGPITAAHPRRRWRTHLGALVGCRTFGSRGSPAALVGGRRRRGREPAGGGRRAEHSAPAAGDGGQGRLCRRLQPCVGRPCRAAWQPHTAAPRRRHNQPPRALAWPTAGAPGARRGASTHSRTTHSSASRPLVATPRHDAPPACASPRRDAPRRPPLCGDSDAPEPVAAAPRLAVGRPRVCPST
jgi:hypothetical protein